jgi:hypothetical protein
VDLGASLGVILDVLSLDLPPNNIKNRHTIVNHSSVWLPMLLTLGVATFSAGILPPYDALSLTS